MSNLPQNRQLTSGFDFGDSVLPPVIREKYPCLTPRPASRHVLWRGSSLTFSRTLLLPAPLFFMNCHSLPIRYIMCPYQIMCSGYFMILVNLLLPSISNICILKVNVAQWVQLFVSPQTIQSVEFSRPEYLRGKPFPSPGDLPNPGIKPRSPALQADSLPAEPQGKPKNPGVGSLSLLQWIFLTQESNQGLLHCRQILYQLSYQGSPVYS